MKNARAAKKDEFYTQYEDIQAEINHYEDKFRDKTVLCNCDDPFESNFFQFFIRNFNFLGLKRLICTCYRGSPVAYTQLGLFDDMDQPATTEHGYVIDVRQVPMANGRGVTDTDIRTLLSSKKRGVKRLKGDGDFRSEECIDYLKQADIIVTNPPFSLFREYLAQLVAYDKKFLIIGNQNAITYKEVFPLIQNNRLWLGCHCGDMSFTVPNDYEERATRYWQDETGQKWRSLGNICWYTNLDHAKRHEELVLYRHYYGSEESYPKYDNYDAINVDRVSEIPCDYFEGMGVPITFLDKHNPEQFEIIGLTQRGCHDEKLETKKYDDYWEVRPNGTKTGSSGSKTNGNPNIAKNDGVHNYFINADGHIVQSCYQRILIKRRVNHENRTQTDQGP